MRFILPLFLFGMLATSCIDNNYDLSEIDTDGVVIGDEFRLPLATVTVSMSELGKDGTDIKALFDEADIWLPSPLPADGKYVDLQKIQHTPSYIDELLDELIEQMKRSDAKINAVADLLYDKYLGTFLPLLPPNTDPKDFKQVFITMFRATTGLQEELAGETRLHENDLRQIIDGTEIILPVKLEKYFPGSGFTPDQKIVIALRLVKRGGLKLNL